MLFGVCFIVINVAALFFHLGNYGISDLDCTVAPQSITSSFTAINKTDCSIKRVFCTMDTL